jgi:hypothetical protein
MVNSKTLSWDIAASRGLGLVHSRGRTERSDANTIKAGMSVSSCRPARAARNAAPSATYLYNLTPSIYPENLRTHRLCGRKLAGDRLEAHELKRS